MTAIAVSAFISCSGDDFVGNDPPGYSCEYAPVGDTSNSAVRPSAEQLGMFDAWALVKVTGHEETPASGNPINLAEVVEVVDGDLAEGDSIDLRDEFGVCFETGEEYYVLAQERDGGAYFETTGPWTHFPVINNRITMHLDIRRDELVGDLHGLDPVLFKRQLVELTGRDDIEVD